MSGTLRSLYPEIEPFQSGTLTFAAGDSGYKRMFQDGKYPSKEFLRNLNPEFEDVFETKMNAPVLPLGAALHASLIDWNGGNRKSEVVRVRDGRRGRQCKCIDCAVRVESKCIGTGRHTEAHDHSCKKW